MYAVGMFIAGVAALFFILRFWFADTTKRRVLALFYGVLAFSLAMFFVGLESGARNQKIEKVLSGHHYLEPNSCVQSLKTTASSITSERFYIVPIPEITTVRNPKDEGKHLHEESRELACLQELNQEKVHYNIAEGYIAIEAGGVMVRSDGMISTQVNELYPLSFQKKESFSDTLQLAFNLVESGYKLNYKKELLSEETKPLFVQKTELRTKYEAAYRNLATKLDNFSLIVIEGSESDKDGLTELFKKENVKPADDSIVLNIKGDYYVLVDEDTWVKLP